MNRKRKLIGLLVGFTVTASVALAAWFAVGLIEGTATTTTGNTTTENLALTEIIGGGEAEALIPGAFENVILKVGPARADYTVTGAEVSLTTSNEVACDKSNFLLKAPMGFPARTPFNVNPVSFTYANPVTVKAGESYEENGYEIGMKETAPEGCKEIVLTVSTKLDHS